MRRSCYGTSVAQDLSRDRTLRGRLEGTLDKAVFSLDADAARLGTFGGATFTAAGQGAGKGTVIAQVGSISGTTGVIVIVHRTDLGPGVPADGATHFPDAVSPAGAQSPSIVYPLQGAVVPTSVKAPACNRKAQAPPITLSCACRIGPGAVDTISRTIRSRAEPPAERWQRWRAARTVGQVAVEHWDSATGAQGSTPINMKMVPANITGAIYYWNLNAGQMEKIDANGRTVAIKSPPPRSDGKRCVACHAVSRDGRYLSAGVWDGGQQGAVFDMSSDAVTNNDPAPTVNPLAEGSSYTVLFSTFNPDATRLMINRGTGLDVIDPKLGTTVATTGLPTTGVAHPAWSPDGTSVALVRNITQGGNAPVWSVDYDRGDLAVMSVSGDNFTGPATLVPAAAVDPAFAAPSWPSFAPDSEWIAYGAGSNSRGRNDSINAVYPGTLFLVSKNTGIPYRLDTACGGARNCYLPNFSPYDEGGYYWLVFYSTRDYGNAQAGTKGTSRRQLWVTAISKAKLANGDASAVPYWLPDQDVGTPNMSAYWALPPPVQ